MVEPGAIAELGFLLSHVLLRQKSSPQGVTALRKGSPAP